MRVGVDHGLQPGREERREVAPDERAPLEAAGVREVVEHARGHPLDVALAQRGVQRKRRLHLEAHVVCEVAPAAARQRAHHGVERDLAASHALAQLVLVEGAAKGLLAGGGEFAQLVGHVGAGVLVIGVGDVDVDVRAAKLLAQPAEGGVVGVAGHRAIGDQAGSGEHLGGRGSQQDLVERAVRLGHAALLGLLDQAVLGMGGADEVREGLGHERSQPHGVEDLCGQEDAREDCLAGMLEGVRNALERHAGADARARELRALGEVARLEALGPEAREQQVCRPLRIGAVLFLDERTKPVNDYVGRKAASVHVAAPLP